MLAQAFKRNRERIGEGFRRRFREWVNRRIPPARSVTLDQKRVFIFPSKAGFSYGFCLLILLIAAINYENNMSFALTFLLATLFIVATLHTFANLSGLTIHALRASPAFPGQQSEYAVRIVRNRKKSHFALTLRWPDSSEAVVDLTDQDAIEVPLHAPVGTRGWHSPGRLLVESTFPLGLLRCWTWIDLDLYALVYPQPLATGPLPGLASDTPDGAAVPIPGSDDFYGFRNYQPGDSLKQLHWKGLAKGQSLQSKQYGAYADRSVWLDWAMFEGVGVEQRLSQLCFWALEFDRSNEEYGLRLPGLTLAPGLGDKHRDQVLKALALYGLEDKLS